MVGIATSDEPQRASVSSAPSAPSRCYRLFVAAQRDKKSSSLGRTVQFRQIDGMIRRMVKSIPGSGATRGMFASSSGSTSQIVKPQTTLGLLPLVPGWSGRAGALSHPGRPGMNTIPNGFFPTGLPNERRTGPERLADGRVA